MSYAFFSGSRAKLASSRGNIWTLAQPLSQRPKHLLLLPCYSRDGVQSCPSVHNCLVPEASVKFVTHSRDVRVARDRNGGEIISLVILLLPPNLPINRKETCVRSGQPDELSFCLVALYCLKYDYYDVLFIALLLIFFGAERSWSWACCLSDQNWIPSATSIRMS